MEPLAVAIYACQRGEVGLGSQVLVLGAGPAHPPREASRRGRCLYRPSKTAWFTSRARANRRRAKQHREMGAVL